MIPAKGPDYWPTMQLTLGREGSVDVNKDGQSHESGKNTILAPVTASRKRSSKNGTPFYRTTAKKKEHRGNLE